MDFSSRADAGVWLSLASRPRAATNDAVPAGTLWNRERQVARFLFVRRVNEVRAQFGSLIPESGRTGGIKRGDAA